MPRPVKVGRKERMTFAKINEVCEMPNLIDVQTQSYKWFVEEGLSEVLEDVSPIRDTTNTLSLEFADYHFSEETKYSQEECKERETTYATSLTVKVRLINRETGEIKEQDVFMGEFPLMTEKGTFIYNGAERAIVTQLVRSPGPYFEVLVDKSNQNLFSSTIIPNRGAWLEYETDSAGIIYVRVDRTRKLPITAFLRALGLDSNQDILDTFGDDDRLIRTLEKDNTKNSDEGVKEIYRRLRPGDPPTVENARSMLNSLLFDARRYDLAKVGRYKYNKKLGIHNRLVNSYAAEDIIDPNTGEILVEKDGFISRAKAYEIENAGVLSALIRSKNENDDSVAKVIGNQFVDPTGYVDIDLAPYKLSELVYYPVLKDIIDNAETEDDLKAAIASRKHELSPKHVILADIIASVSYLLNLNYGLGEVDDIDHLGNRRLKTVGELLQNQFRIGFSRMERSVRERMTNENATPQQLINIRPVTAAVREFFGSSQLSQFMDQNNPLSELTHKRRLSALGPGGLSRDRAGFEVRDVHYTHYGRLCPIETPEGSNIGLISYLASFAKINKYGFIEAPYRRVDKETGVVTDEVVYMPADVEDEYIVAQANEPLDENNRFVRSRVSGRHRNDIQEFAREQVDFMDVSPRMMVSVATACIPFLENDDCNRALMGSNMQRQAVPLMVTQRSLVATGMEYKAATDSGVCVLAAHDGTVESVDADKVVVRLEDGSADTYELIKFMRSNQGTCVNQRPAVYVGDVVKKAVSYTHLRAHET